MGLGGDHKDFGLPLRETEPLQRFSKISGRSDLYPNRLTPVAWLRGSKEGKGRVGRGQRTRQGLMVAGTRLTPAEEARSGWILDTA